MKRNIVYSMVAAAAITAVAGSALVSFAAKPDFAGKDVSKEDRQAAVKAMVEAKIAERAVSKEQKAQDRAQKAMDMANALSEKLQAKAAELGITVPAEVVGNFNSLMIEAQTAFDAGDFKTAQLKANEAKGALAPLDELIDSAEGGAEAPETEQPAVE